MRYELILIILFFVVAGVMETQAAARKKKKNNKETEVSYNGDVVVGQKPKEPLIQFTKIDSTIQLRQIFNYSITRKQNENIAKAIEKANIGAIIGVYKIEAYNPDSTAVVIEMTKLSVGDNKFLINEPLVIMKSAESTSSEDFV
ncbi:DUF5117 domain-containing protein [uncultured Sanguibacteroides sp.]|uniref:DUF5117 domain-containing protein n=1 Tax=uncultured Sanguibacteroides sp. TaxID=1635151 RepID=UPI0025DE1D14|nr:DUF5117 domain-containing protein [uncultured Sanguibacteroides sp.]